MSESIVEKLRKHLEETPREELDREFEELKEWNDVGPTVEEYVAQVKEYHSQTKELVETIWEKYNEYKETAEQHEFVQLFLFDSKLVPAYEDLKNNWNIDHANTFIRGMLNTVFPTLGIDYMKRPTNTEEAIAELDKMLSDEDNQYLKDNGAISVHHTLGRWIRNEWGLWKGSMLKANLEKEGFSHPDDMSNHILEKYVEHLRSGE